MKYPHIAARIFNTPLLIHPQKLDAIIAGLSDRLLGAVPLAVAAADGSRMLAPELFSTRRGEASDRGYRVVEGVAVLNISGALLHRSRLDMAESTFLVGYNDLAADLEDAMGHPDVHAVLQVYDSPGGEAQGAFEYAQRVFDLRGRKPMQAIADGMALSAAYLGASAADEVAVTATGYAGSVGVVSRHVDFSRALDQDGITVTHIFAGAHKVDGNPYEPLPEDVRSAWQAEIDGLYTMFVDAVARHRGMDAVAVRKTQAASYSGVAAVASGLADRIATTDQLISELAAQRSRSFPVGPTARSNANDKGVSMSGTTTNEAGGHQAAAATAGTPPAAPGAFTQAHVDAARAEGRDEGAKTERTRVSGIFAHEAAAGRTQLAIQCVTSGLTVEQAGAVLGAAPAAAPASSANAFATAMATLGNPDVSGVEAATGAAADEAALASQIVSSFRGSR
ncbi:putative phage head-tail preconnector protein GP5 [Variovorax paradoxus B4]|uniref:Putative phage head-tail preconnector protein GP5 n=1 Tax=Variovorax paradoxus B4 TaxID=1246301 RepID=T1XGS0_VARPD|nr:S49 family peptidase [Variovorax paradoxus]AGU51534.1 putative phage head-tail preconnector protein GP5 [Variovorax paradoxus B4]